MYRFVEEKCKPNTLETTSRMIFDYERCAGSLTSDVFQTILRFFHRVCCIFDSTRHVPHVRIHYVARHRWGNSIFHRSNLVAANCSVRDLAAAAQFGKTWQLASTRPALKLVCSLGTHGCRKSFDVELAQLGQESDDLDSPRDEREQEEHRARP